MKKTSAFLAVVGLASLGFAAAALAQSDTQDEIPARKLDRLERQVNEVRQIVLQAKATGKPIEIREAGPDPAIIAFQGRLDDIDQSLRNLNGQIEVMTHDLDLARKDATEARAKAEALEKRVEKLEAKLDAMQAPPPAAVSDGPAPSTAPPPFGASATPPPPPPAAADEPAAAYGRAKQMLLNGDYPAASAAFQDYVDRYGDSQRGPEARYWLGETRYIQADYSGAASAYIDAVRGWPQTAWAPEALTKLALALVQLKKPIDACGILAALPAHYPKLSDKAKARAAEARAKAQCAP